MALRLFFFLLVLANLIFFAWTQGHFGPTDEGREPERLGQQLHADKLRVSRLDTAPAKPKAEEPVCRSIDGLALADAESLKAAIEAGGGTATLVPAASPTLHLVLIPELANKAAADRKAGELSRLGVEPQSIVVLEGGRHEILLGSFDAEPAAREFLLTLTKRGIKSARQEARQQPATNARIDARLPSTALRQLPQWLAPHSTATVGECAG